MRPPALLHLVTTVSPLVVLAWQSCRKTLFEMLDEEAKEIFDALQQAQRQNTLGAIYSQFGDWEQATAAYMLALDWSKIARDAVSMGTALNGLGTILLYRQRYKLARQCFCNALQYLEQTKDHSLRALTLHNLGMAEHFMGRHSTALEALEKALFIRGELWDIAGEAITLSRMGRIYFAQQQFAYALACYEAALDLCRQKAAVFEGHWFEANIHCLIAQLSEQCGHPDLAIGHYLDALKLDEGLSVEWTLSILQSLSQLHEQVENPALAVYYRQQALEMVRQLGTFEGNNVIAIAPLKGSNPFEGTTSTPHEQAPSSYFASTHPLSLYF